MVNEQKIYVDKIKEFAKLNGYQVVKSTYGNKPGYDDLKEAPVVKIETNTDSITATALGRRIMTELFNCDTTTNFDVVP